MISVEHLTKRYGDFTAVDDLSFEIDEGHVYGFLGPNGAGKTTTMNILTGCLSATAGSARINGYDIFEEPDKAKRLIGYLPEQPPLYMTETPAEYLRFVGEAKGLRGTALLQQIDEVIGQTKIADVKNRRISDLSKGYRQRVGIAQALIGNPKVIILDEPTVGLDPIQIIEIRALIQELGCHHTVIFSSHILSEVQAICDRILIISKGRLIAFDDSQNMEKRLLASNEIVLTADGDAQETEQILSGIEQIVDMSIETGDGGYARVHLKTDCENIYEVSRAVFQAFASQGRALLEMSLKKANLEEVFIELTEGAEDVECPETENIEIKTEESAGSDAPMVQAKGDMNSDAVREPEENAESESEESEVFEK